ncbi:hypothetical protein LTR93_008340 [Exophiala xenobiotica]|nr:hypothetical protein LTR93_008340 [Exophiala xenobiotica]KAK5405051.1 hypothetical protein LTR06_009318 [Exophiala xenobiotica]
MSVSNMASMTMSTATSTAAAASATSSAMSMSMGGSSTCKISMLWNWTTIDACFLSSSWHITSKGMFAASCIGVIFLVVSLEFFRRISKEYDLAILRQFQRKIAAQDSRKSPNCSTSCGIGSQLVMFRASPLQQLIRAVLHAATFGIAYIIMLLAMYFNGYLIICIFIGAGLGKFLCDWPAQRMTVRGLMAHQKDHTIEEPTVCCG